MVVMYGYCATASCLRSCCIRKRAEPTTKLNDHFVIPLRIDELVVPAKLFAVLSDERFWSASWNPSNCIFQTSHFPAFKPNSKPGGRPVKVYLPNC